MQKERESKPRCRGWALPRESWVNLTDNRTAAERATSTVFTTPSKAGDEGPAKAKAHALVPVGDDDGAVCRICSESLEQVFDQVCLDHSYCEMLLL